MAAKTFSNMPLPHETRTILNPYESAELLHQYMVFHYASAEEQFPYSFGASDALGFPQRCALEGPDYASLPKGARALDLGCAVGRSSFELARACQHVIGVDYSRVFIDAANYLKHKGIHTAERLDEGSTTTQINVSIDPTIDRSRVQFEQGDAQHLRSDVGKFDLVLACNLICRLPEPTLLLNRLSDLIKSGGQLFITSPFTWLEAYTQRSHWLGDGAEDSYSGLRKSLEPNFRLAKSWDMPFIIREHARKYQYSVAQASRWIRAN